jgi:hypothetical protein
VVVFLQQLIEHRSNGCDKEGRRIKGQGALSALCIVHDVGADHVS